MDYKLLWKGRLWSVAIPDGVPLAYAWPYVLKYVATCDHTAAMMFVLQQQYPGLGFGTPCLVPVSVVTSPNDADDVFVSDKSAHGARSNKDSQRPQGRPVGQVAKGVVSGTSDRRRPIPQPATSSASRPLFRESKVSVPRPVIPLSRPAATARTAGWMGSAPTSAGVP